MFTFDPTVKLGDLLTSLSVTIASLALMMTWLKDRRIRQKEYADRIRRAAADTVVALQRWKELAIRLYDDIQPLLTDSDMQLVQIQDYIKVRDSLWRGLVAARAEASRRILAEKIETAYIGLYGYHPEVQAAYDTVVSRLSAADSSAYHELLKGTQLDVVSFDKAAGPYKSAQLGNALRLTARRIELELRRMLDSAIEPFRLQMLRLIELPDADLVTKKVFVLQAASDSEPDPKAEVAEPSATSDFRGM